MLRRFARELTLPPMLRRFARELTLPPMVRRFARKKIAVLGLILVGAILTMAILAPVVAPYPSLDTNLADSLQAPSLKHLFGTDNLGKDILSEVLWGARTSVLIAITSISAATLLGFVIGATAGYFGGWTDNILSRLIEMFLAIPRDLLAILLVALLGSTVWNIILALTIAFWPVTARVVRGEYLGLKNRPYVEAARMVGAGHRSIILGEILPAALPVMVVNATFLTSQAFLSEAGLSFLGLNDPNVSSWGKMVFNAMPHVRFGWWTAVVPGVAVSIVVLGLNLAGDGLNEVINPKMSRVTIFSRREKRSVASKLLSTWRTRRAT